jgi:hypothetical protein
MWEIHKRISGYPSIWRSDAARHDGSGLVFASVHSSSAAIARRSFFSYSS